VHDDLLTARQRDLEAHRRHRRQQLEVVLTLKALAHNVHVQQAEKAGAEAEAERVRALGSQDSAASLRVSFSSASRSSGKRSESIGKRPQKTIGLTSR